MSSRPWLLRLRAAGLQPPLLVLFVAQDENQPHEPPLIPRLGSACKGSETVDGAGSYTSHSRSSSGSALHHVPSTTSMGGSSACTPRAMTLFAVPRRPMMAMPPSRLSTQPSSSACGRGPGSASASDRRMAAARRAEARHRNARTDLQDKAAGSQQRRVRR